MRPFTFESRIPRTVFGSGTFDKIKDEVQRLEKSRALIIVGTSARQQELGQRAEQVLGALSAGICARAVQHTPKNITDEALSQAGEARPDCLIAIGGGSAIGLGKALVTRLDIPLLCVPTTYSGSEGTAILGETENGKKVTRTDPRVLPTTIIYDIDLTLSMPFPLSCTSGFNAIAHCVESLYSEQTNPIIRGAAFAGIQSMAGALVRLKTDLNDKDARSDALGGAWAAGVCLGQSSMGLHHKLCHTLGGSFGLPHAESHTVVLPHVIAYNEAAASDAMQVVRAALGAKEGVSAAQAMWDLQETLGTVQSLQGLGMRPDDLDKAADLAAQAQYPNPAPLNRERLLVLLRNAFYGREPAMR